MSTLPPEPVINPNLPIVTSNAGNPAAYKDPNSPESIMKKSAKLNEQANEDSRYDIVQGFRSKIKSKSTSKEQKKSNSSTPLALIITLIIVVFIIYSLYKLFKFGIKVILFIILLIVIISLVAYKNG